MEETEILVQYLERMHNIILGNRGNGGLGDCLFFTPLFRNNTGTVILHNDKQSREVSTVLDGIAKIEFCDLPPERPDSNCNTPIHRCKKIMRAFGINDEYCIPFIKLTSEEITKAKDVISQYKNPVVIINNNSGDWDPTNFRAHYVRGEPSNMQVICNQLIENGCTPLQFGLEDDRKFTKLNRAIHIRGLNIRETASCFYHIKKFVGTDSGLYHLMLSVGGRCIVSIPLESIPFGYIYSDLLYTKECFGTEEVRVKYFNHGDINILTELGHYAK